MNVKAAWIPKSERGREVARILRRAGYQVRDRDVQGHYLCNVNAVRNENLEYSVRREIAYALNAEAAETAENDAVYIADQMRLDPRAYGVKPEDAELVALIAEEDWC